MAYGNWGGRAYRNGEHMAAHEDNTPYREGALAAGYWQAFARSEERDPHHVTLGSQRVRLCGYQSYPVLFVDGVKVDIEPYVTERDGYTTTAGAGDLTLDGTTYRFEWQCGDDPARVDLFLLEPDGARWDGFRSATSASRREETRASATGAGAPMSSSRSSKAPLTPTRSCPGASR